MVCQNFLCQYFPLCGTLLQELEESKTSQIERMEQLLSELEHTQQEYQRVKVIYSISN